MKRMKVEIREKQNMDKGGSRHIGAHYQVRLRCAGDGQAGNSVRHPWRADKPQLSFCGDRQLQASKMAWPRGRQHAQNPRSESCRECDLAIYLALRFRLSILPPNFLHYFSFHSPLSSKKLCCHYHFSWADTSSIVSLAPPLFITFSFSSSFLSSPSALSRSSRLLVSLSLELLVF